MWFGYGRPAVSPIPSTLAAFHDPSVPRYEHARPGPKRSSTRPASRAAPTARASPLSHDFLPYGDDYRRTGEYLKQALRRVGIEVDIRAQDSAAFIQRVYADRDFDISSSYNAAFPDPQIGVVREYWSGWLGTGTPGPTAPATATTRSTR